MIRCSKCNRELGGQHKEERVVSISGSIMGDEYTDTYYYCDACGVYTLEVYHDRFLGEEDSSVQGPISKAEGEAKVELIKQCAQPWDKKCRCTAHKSYFGDSLD